VSVKVHERLESRDVSRIGGKLTARRQFHVFDDATPLATPGSVIVLFGSNGLPYYGEEFPESPNLRARDYRLSLVAGHRDLWAVEWEYSEAELATFPQRQPGEVGYTEVTARTIANFVDAWRVLSKPDIANKTKAGGDNQYGAGSTVDIGGTPIDAAGEPLQDVVRQIEIQITEVVGGVSSFAPYLEFVWRRNNSTFLGAQIGQLLYLGAQINRIDVAKYQFTHTFLLDRWWHMRQRATKWSDGRTPLMDVNGRKHAESVTFVQPFPDYANFFAMSPNFTQTAGAFVINVPILGFP
jgi:hypothetical protein